MKSNIPIYKVNYLLFSSIFFCFSSFIPKVFQQDLLAQQQKVSTDAMPVKERSDSSRNYTESVFPGGKHAWMLHLMKTLRYPAAAQSKNIQGTVVVKFEIDEKGRLKNLEAITGPEELRAEAIRVVRAGGKWTPASENGHAVKSVREQSLVFRTESADNQVAVKPDPGAAIDSSGTRKVDEEIKYPGGAVAWMRYLNKTFRYPMEAQANEIQGTVMVMFTVDEQGNVSDIQAISGPEKGGLREEAIRMIRKSGKWEPAIINGQPVKSNKEQPISFRLARE